MDSDSRPKLTSSADTIVETLRKNMEGLPIKKDDQEEGNKKNDLKKELKKLSKEQKRSDHNPNLTYWISHNDQEKSPKRSVQFDIVRVILENKI